MKPLPTLPEAVCRSITAIFRRSRSGSDTASHPRARASSTRCVGHQLVRGGPHHADAMTRGGDGEVDPLPGDVDAEPAGCGGAGQRAITTISPSWRRTGRPGRRAGAAGARKASKHDQVSAAARRDGPAVVQAENSSAGFQRGNADGHERIQSLGDRRAHHVIDMPVVQQVGGLAVVGAKANAVADFRGVTSGNKRACRLLRVGRLADEDHMPRRSFSRASSTVVHSWSEHDARGDVGVERFCPVNRGQCPSSGRAVESASILASTRGSPRRRRESSSPRPGPARHGSSSSADRSSALQDRAGRLHVRGGHAGRSHDVHAERGRGGPRQT